MLGGGTTRLALGTDALCTWMVGGCVLLPCARICIGNICDVCVGVWVCVWCNRT